MLSGPGAPSGSAMSSGKTQAIVVVVDIDQPVITASGAEIPTIIDPGPTAADRFSCLTVTQLHYASTILIRSSTILRKPALWAKPTSE